MKQFHIIYSGLTIIFTVISLYLIPPIIYAAGKDAQCLNSDQTAKLDAAGKPIECDRGLTCQFKADGYRSPGGYCVPGSSYTSTPVDRAVGKIQAPEFIKNLGFGAAGISNVLSNVVQIIYIVAAIVFVFMVVISAFQWIISGGDKEKISQARSRLTNAIIGIILLALAFLIIRVVGQLTGYEFFSGQNNSIPQTIELPQYIPGAPQREGDPSRSQGDSPELQRNLENRLPCNPGDC